MRFFPTRKLERSSAQGEGKIKYKIHKFFRPLRGRPTIPRGSLNYSTDVYVATELKAYRNLPYSEHVDGMQIIRIPFIIFHRMNGAGYYIQASTQLLIHLFLRMPVHNQYFHIVVD